MLRQNQGYVGLHPCLCTFQRRVNFQCRAHFSMPQTFFNAACIFQCHVHFSTPRAFLGPTCILQYRVHFSMPSAFFNAACIFQRSIEFSMPMARTFFNAAYIIQVFVEFPCLNLSSKLTKMLKDFFLGSSQKRQTITMLLYFQRARLQTIKTHICCTIYYSKFLLFITNIYHK